ncbi:pRiA4b ORF-3-like protein [Candidatus Methanophagaceae archaeon]|nr:pRiA4b ORF-3-like protein [Methanophagales archaeon]
MKKKYTQVYQFKITLKGIKPPIWRWIQVPETYTFWELHLAIQNAMSWTVCHLHEFELVNPETGLKQFIGTQNEDFGDEVLPESNKKIADYFSMENQSAVYTYDFGDNWEHKIQLEKIVPREKR